MISVRLPSTSAVALLLFALPVLSLQTYAQKKNSKDDDNETQKEEEIKKDKNDTLHKTGFFLDANTGYNYRFTRFGSQQPSLHNSLTYSSLNVGVFRTSVNAGLMGISMLEFEYETPYPRTQFGQKALEFRKDQRHGLEKYTLGIDLTPLWRWVLPEGTPGFLVVLPSFQVRYTRELTKNTATTQGGVLYLVPPGSDDSDHTINGLNFADVPSGTKYSFRTKFQYVSVTWGHTRRDSTGVLVDTGIGPAAWTYSRIQQTQFPQISGERPVVYDARTIVLGAAMYGKYLPETGFRQRLRGAIGLGDVNSETHEQETLDQLFQPAGRAEGVSRTLQGSNAIGTRLEYSVSYRFSLFPTMSDANLYVEPGIKLDYFSTHMPVFEKSILRDDEQDNTYIQGGFMFFPWMKVTLGIN